MSNHRESFWMRLGGIDGVIAPVVAFIFIGLAITTSPQFSWVNNALSDLGVVPGATASLFNSGLVVSGFLSLNFAIGLYKFLNKNVLGKVGAVIFAAASLSLDGIGWAPENVHPFDFPLHYFFSVAFFSLIPISLLVIAGYFLFTKENRLAFFTLLIAVFAAVEWIVYFQFQYVPGVAVPELLSALAGSIWIMAIGWRMFKSVSQPKNN